MQSIVPKRKQNLVLSLILGHILLLGCGHKLHSTLIYRESLVEIYLAQTIGDGGLPINSGFQHPKTFTPLEINRLLKSVHVRHGQGTFKKFISKSDSPIEPAFSDEEVDQMSFGLSKALERASSDDRIHFQLKHPVVLYGANLSTGVVFIKNNRFQIILQTHKYAPGVGVYQQDARFEDPRVVDYSQDLSLLPGPFQEFSKSERVELKNRWLLIDYKGLLASQSKPDSDDSLSEDVFERRLEALKRWKEKGLITEEEYEQNRKEVLKQLME